MWAPKFSLVVLLAGTVLAQEINYIPEDVADGKQYFLESCASCHGPDGDAVQGVDFGHGKFRRARSDEDILHFIQNGSPDTGMPPINISTEKARSIVAYLRSMVSSAGATYPKGDSTRGKTLFEGKGKCLRCHRVRDKGSRVGPDLTDIGVLRRAHELELSLLEPNAEVLPENRFVRLVTQDGRVITGRLLNHDGFTVQLIDADERLLSLQKSGLREFVILDRSLMPSYKEKLTHEELVDIVSYLVSLKGVDAQ